MGRYLAAGLAGGIAIGLLLAFLSMYGLAMVRSMMSIC